MNDRMRESLSALMDDEANELELERVLSQLRADDELRQTWTRYNLAQQTLHSHQCAHVGWDISARVQSALAGTQMDVVTGTHGRARGRLLRPLISFGIAASVAVTVVVGGKQLMQMGSIDQSPFDVFHIGEKPVGPLAIPVRASFGPQSSSFGLQPVPRTAYQDLAQQRWRHYMQEHAEQATLNSPQGVVSFARVPEIRE
jgi:sigma-E factor negative regulatory protein RseA